MTIHILPVNNGEVGLEGPIRYADPFIRLSVAQFDEDEHNVLLTLTEAEEVAKTLLTLIETIKGEQVVLPSYRPSRLPSGRYYRRKSAK